MDASPPSSPISAVVGVGAFGKIPKAGDFVRAGFSNEVTRAFEEWLHKSVLYAHEKHGSAWKQPFVAGSMYAFAFRVPVAADRSGLIAGVLQPSQDSVGRAFPLAIYAMVDDATAKEQPAALPLQLGEFLDQAAALAMDVSTLDASMLDARVRSMPAPALLDDDGRAYRSWIHTTPIDQLLQTVFGHGWSDRSLRTLSAIADTALPLRGRDASTTQLALRLPVGSLGVTTTCVWLDIIRAMARSENRVLTSFWFFDGHRGDLLVHLGRVHVSSMIELWMPDRRNDHVYDLRSADTVSHVSADRIDRSVVACLKRGAYVAELYDALRY